MHKLTKSIYFLYFVDILIFILTFYFFKYLFLIEVKTFIITTLLMSTIWTYILWLKTLYLPREIKFHEKAYSIIEGISLGVISVGVLLLYFNFSQTYFLYLLLSAFVVSGLMLIWRYCFDRYTKSIKPYKNVLILGAGDAGATVINQIHTHPLLKYNIIGLLDKSEEVQDTEVNSSKVIGKLTDIDQIVKNNKVDILILCITGKIEKKSLKAISDCILENNLRLINYADAYEFISQKVPVCSNSVDYFIDLLANTKKPFYNLLKRIFDIASASIITIATAPIMLILAISIKIQDGGNIFYLQNRVGKEGKEFNMYKFRTMIEKSEENGAVWACNNNKDPRVTPIGKIARKTRFDELPQMFNIIKGDMSIVGPRPERPEFVRLLTKEVPFYNERHCILPGWTGWAQIMYRYGASIEDAAEKLRYDYYYIKHRNIFWDFSILLKAVCMALSGRHG